jgi:GT2 family glycosyltransferase
MRPRPVDWLTAAALLLRRRAVEEVGGFDEGFFMFSEETDLCRRIWAAGYEVQWFPSVTVVHHVGHTTAGVRERRINEMWRSRHRYWAKHHSPAGARVAAASTGLQYAARAAIARLVLRDPDFAARMRLHARAAWRGPQGEGLRERAETWNAERAPSRESVEA